MQRPEHTFRWRRGGRTLRAVAGMPEWNVAIFALLLNFPWEVLQAPLFAGMAEAPFFEAIKGCSQGTNIGVTPLLQWVVLPLLVIWFVRRQIQSQAGGRNEAA